MMYQPLSYELKKVLFAGLFVLSAVQVPAQDLQYVREVIATLGSERMEGRGYAAKGEERAAAYVRREFIKNGLMPLFPGYYQPFHVDVNTFPSKVELTLNGTRLVPGIDFLVEPSSPKCKGRFDLKVIDVQDFLHNDSLLYNPDLKDHFLLIDNRTNAVLDAQEREILSKKITVMQDNPLTETVGILEIMQDLPEWGISGHVSLRPFFKVGLPVDPDTLASVKVNLTNRFRQGYTTHNIAGYLKGTTYPDSFLVFTAHYDHIGMMGRDAFFPGANDNASGVAMLMYLSRYFQANPSPVSILFVVFSGEELGLVGSFHFTRHSPIDLSRVRFVVNFDMVGTGSDGIKVVNGSLYTKEFTLLKNINERDHLLPDVTARSPTCISDHCPFDYQNVPAFYIYTEGDAPPYHNVFDIVDNLTLAGFTGLANLIIEFASSL